MFSGQNVCQVHVHEGFVGTWTPVYLHRSPKGIMRTSAIVQTSHRRYQSQSWDTTQQAPPPCTQGRPGSCRSPASFSWAI